MSSSLPAEDLRVGQRCGTLGYLVAVTPYLRQDEHGNVIESEAGYLTLYFRSKPMSPRGKIRGVPTGTFEALPGDLICTD